MAPHDDRRRRRPRACADPTEGALEALSALETPRNRLGVPSLCLVVDDQVNRRPSACAPALLLKGRRSSLLLSLTWTSEGPAPASDLASRYDRGEAEPQSSPHSPRPKALPVRELSPFSAPNVIVTQDPVSSGRTRTQSKYET
jgi:hypothetical protein